MTVASLCLLLHYMTASDRASYVLYSTVAEHSKEFKVEGL